MSAEDKNATQPMAVDILQSIANKALMSGVPPASQSSSFINESKRVEVIESITLKPPTHTDTVLNSEGDSTDVHANFEPSPSTSKALDSALMTNEFELLSSAIAENSGSLDGSKYLTRSKCSPRFPRISYAETDCRLTDKYIVPRRVSPLRKNVGLNQKSKRNKIVDRTYVKKRNARRSFTIHSVETNAAALGPSESVDSRYKMKHLR